MSALAREGVTFLLTDIEGSTRLLQGAALPLAEAVAYALEEHCT